MIENPFATSDQLTGFALAVVAAVAGFYLAFRWLARARVIEDTPTARIRSAHQGYVELTGTAEALEGPPIAAPLTGTVCCWYRYSIEKKGNKNWRTLESDTSDELFLLRDDTGQCIIDPEGAEVTPTERSVWYGTSRYPQNRQPAARRVEQAPLFTLARTLNTDISFGGRYRYTEERVYPGDALYALGLFKTRDALDEQRDQQELTRELLQQWKRNKSQLLQQFDLNRDGQIDQQEWELVRKAASQQARLEINEQAGAGLHMLGAPESGKQPYLLSTLPQFDLVRRYRFMAAAGMVMFIVGGGAAIWLYHTPI